jgi:hypothetical protein
MNHANACATRHLMANLNGSGQLAKAAFYRAGFHAKAQSRKRE